MVSNVERRNTIQLQKVLDYLKSVKTHPNAETVYSKVKKDIPFITRATVYRNLNKLTEEGKICKLEINGEYRFDADCRIHEHLVCRECNKVMENFSLNEKMIKNFKSKKFSPTSVNVIFYGYCADCSKK